MNRSSKSGHRVGIDVSLTLSGPLSFLCSIFCFSLISTFVTPVLSS